MLYTGGDSSGVSFCSGTSGDIVSTGVSSGGIFSMDAFSSGGGVGGEGWGASTFGDIPLFPSSSGVIDFKETVSAANLVGICNKNINLRSYIVYRCLRTNTA